MQELCWLEHLPDGTLEGGLELINDFYWNLVTWEHEGKWYAQAGEKTLLVTDSQQALQAFVYGMALSCNVIPENILEIWKAQLDEELD